MATITIRDLDDDVKQQLRLRAASHGRSMEAEARAIIGQAVTGTPPGIPKDFKRIRGRWKGRMTTDEVMQMTRES